MSENHNIDEIKFDNSKTITESLDRINISLQRLIEILNKIPSNRDNMSNTRTRRYSNPSNRYNNRFDNRNRNNNY